MLKVIVNLSTCTQPKLLRLVVLKGIVNLSTGTPRELLHQIVLKVIVRLLTEQVRQANCSFTRVYRYTTRKPRL